MQEMAKDKHYFILKQIKFMVILKVMQFLIELKKKMKNKEWWRSLKIFKENVESGLLELSQLEALEDEAKQKIKIAIESKWLNFPQQKIY